MSFLDFASLLTGMANEAKAVRTERHQEENDLFEQSQMHLQQLINNPNTNDGIRNQAAAAAQEMIMEHLGYNKKSKQPNAVRKAIEGMVGQSVPNYGQRVAQIGVGSGNAKTSVGGAPGLAAGGGPPAFGADVDPNVKDTYSGMDGPPAPPQMASPALAPQQQPFFKTSEQKAQEAAQAEMLKEKISRDEKLKWFDSDPYFNSLKDEDPDAYKAARMELATGRTFQSSTNAKVGKPMTVAQLKAFVPDWETKFPWVKSMKEKEMVTVMLNSAGTKVNGAQPGGGTVSARITEGAKPVSVSTALATIQGGLVDEYLGEDGKPFDLQAIANNPNLKNAELVAIHPTNADSYWSLRDQQSRIFTSNGQVQAVPALNVGQAAPTNLGAAPGTLPTTSTTDTNLATGATTTTRTVITPNLPAAAAPRTGAPAVPRPTAPGAPPRPPAGIPTRTSTDTDQSEEAKLGRNWAYFGIPPSGLDTKGKTKVTKWMTDHNLNASQPVPPALRAKLTESMEARNSAIDAVKDLQANATTLSSILSSKKIEFSVEGGDAAKVAVRILAPLSETEAQVAGDWQVLAEHINLLRGPLGATGFRSEKSWKALQDQRGNLMADPRITANALAYTLQNLQKLNSADALILNGGYNNSGASGPPAPPGRKFAVRKSDGHRIYTDDGQKTWHDAATDELVK